MSDKRTVKGKDLSEFFSALGQKVALNEKQDGSVYFGINEVEDRVNELTYPSNFNVECTEPRLVEVGKRQSIIVVVTVELLDDDGKLICRRSNTSGCDISYYRDEKGQDPEKAVSELKSFVATAQSNAYVKCWQALGCGLESLSDRSFKNGKKPKGNKPSTAVMDAVYTIIFTEGFTYDAKTKLLSSKGTVDGKPVNFKIFKEGLQFLCDDYKKNESEIVDCFISNYGPGKLREKITCIGRINTYKNAEQLIFKKLEKKEGK